MVKMTSKWNCFEYWEPGARFRTEWRKPEPCKGNVRVSMRELEKIDVRNPVVRQQAWIGDTVLDLYARTYILREQGEMDGEMLARMTSNQFLSALGNPTGVEAEIGRVYQAQGLEAGFAWIEENLLPLFKKQERKRLVSRR